jgi:hypothetical protein
MRGLLVAIAMLLLPVSAGAGPSAYDILRRVLTINTGTPDVTSADVTFKLRIKKPLNEPPDCEFNGTMQLLSGRQALKVGQRTSGVLCWAVDKYVLGQLFEASEPMGNFLNRFDFSVLGEKMVGEEHYYLIQGRAKDPNNKNPGAMTGWINYDRGLITDGRLDYSWGTVDTEQRYARVEGAWVLAHQFIHSNRFEATLEIAYSHFRFAR